MATSWRLLQDLERGLRGEVDGPTGSAYEFSQEALESDDLRWIDADRAFDGGPWSFRTKPEGEDAHYSYRTSVRQLSSVRDVLTRVLIIMSGGPVDDMAWRWRLAVRLVEEAHPLVTRHASDVIDEDALRLLPLFHWVRWRLLSEPFRAVDERSGAEAGYSSEIRDFSELALGGPEELQQRASKSRLTWAEDLLVYQDHPVLSNIEVDVEGQLVVFCDSTLSTVLQVSSDDLDGGQCSRESFFVAWFSREFFSRRFMVREMWKAVVSRWKLAVALSGTITALLALLVGSTISPVSPLGLPYAGPWWRSPVVPAVLFAAFLVLAMSTLISCLLSERGGESFAYPFLLRFAAGTMIGSAAVITMRAGWIGNLTWPGSGQEWRGGVIVVGLTFAGLIYLLVEARLHGTSGRTTFFRVGSVWLIGLAWASIIAAIDILVIAPVFTEDFFVFSSAQGRFWAFFVTALASLDLGIFLQVLWEDRPVTYPLGALRLSRHG